MSGGGSPTSTTVTQSNVPEWLRPQVETVLGAGMQELFQTQKTGTNDQGRPIYDITGTRPFTPYSTDPRQYVAGFSPLQQQAQSNAANIQVPGQFNQATGMAGAAGMGGLGSAQGGGYYGGMGASYGAQAANLAPSAAFAGRAYANQVTNPYAVSAYMSPYQQNVVDKQMESARRQADISTQSRQAAATRAGAYGGARQAIENAEANRALQSQLGNIEAQGLQSAYQQAMQNMQFGSSLGLQGLGQAGQLYGTGMQGAGVGLQGIGASQAGYGLAGQAAGQLGQLGTQQLAAQQGIIGLQNQFGGQQQAQQQAITNQAIQNYAAQQEAPYNTLSQFNALLRGYAVPGQTMTQYQAAPSPLSQLAGIGGTAASIYGLTQKKAGGVIKDRDGIDDLAIRKIMKQRVAA